MYLKRSILTYIGLAGGIFMAGLFGCTPDLQFEKYASKDPMINLEADYISGWKYSETRGSHASYAQVVFYEVPVEKEDVGAAIVFTVENISEAQASVSAATKNLMNKRMKFKGFRLLAKKKVNLSGEDAVIVDLAYKNLDKLYAPDAKMVPFRERVVILENNGKLYFFRYENSASRYGKFIRAFEHILKSVRFR